MTDSVAHVRLATPNMAPGHRSDSKAVRPSLPRRIAYTVSITVVAVDAAWNSYWHMASVVLRGHQDPFLAYSLPFSVDGMLLVATLAIAEDKAHGRRPRGWARFAFWLGAVVSIAANVASVVVDHGLDPLSIAVSSWPPVALLVVVEVIARPGKSKNEPDASLVVGQLESRAAPFETTHVDTGRRCLSPDAHARDRSGD